MNRIAALFAFLALARALPALEGEFWARADLVDLAAPDGASRGGDGFSDRERAALDALLEDARWVFSGMIYGFDVTWVPSNAAQGVAEDFRMEPLAQISRGDPRMTALSTIEQDGFLYIRLRYETDPSQSARLEGWAGNLFPEAKGYGTARIGPDGQRRAMEDGVKEALRAWLRAREFNRPREVSGRVAFVDVPVLGLVGPRCGASVAIRMDLDPIRPYPAD